MPLRVELLLRKRAAAFASVLVRASISVPATSAGTAVAITLNVALVVLASQQNLPREPIYSLLYLQDAQRPSIVAQSERDVATTTKYARKSVAKDTVPKLHPQKAIPQSSTTMMVITS